MGLKGSAHTSAEKTGRRHQKQGQAHEYAWNRKSLKIINASVVQCFGHEQFMEVLRSNENTDLPDGRRWLLRPYLPGGGPVKSSAMGIAKNIYLVMWRKRIARHLCPQTETKRRKNPPSSEAIRGKTSPTTRTEKMEDLDAFDPDERMIL